MTVRACRDMHMLNAVRDDGFMVGRSVAQAELLAAAKAECEARGWPWREPVRVTGGLFRYQVWTNADVRDDNPWFLFSRTGRLIRAAWAARRA
jgi:hypothetical protein